jgi:CBS domain-containing protein
MGTSSPKGERMKPSDTIRLPIRIRRTVCGLDEADRSSVVYCPRARASRSLASCSECERCDGVVVDDSHRRFILCKPETSAAPPLKRILPTAADVTRIGELLGREVVCVVPELAVGTAAATFLARNLTGAPVVDGEGRPIGMLTRSDLLRALVEPHGARLVNELMMPIAFALAENDSLTHAAALMASEGVHHLPVIGDYGRVIGMLSTLDVTRWLAREAGYDV